MNKNEKNDFQSDLITEIKKAKIEWEGAGEYFNNTNDKELIDYAIYNEDAAKARYLYLLSIAKKKGIKVDYSYSLKVINGN